MGNLFGSVLLHIRTLYIYKLIVYFYVGGGGWEGSFRHKYPFSYIAKETMDRPQCIDCFPSTYMGSCTYYVITDGGGRSFQMITVLHRGVRKMYQCTTNLGVLHQEYMSTDLNFLGGMSRLVHYYRGVGQNDNSFTCGGEAQ